MARLILAAILIALPGVAQDQQFKQAGVCGRCHVISVVEWSVSRHAKATADCVACHGVSEGHVIDERNNVKPERIPRAAAIAGLCATCHAGGCPKTTRKDACQTCHHAHALMDPAKAPNPRDEGLERRAAAKKEVAARMAEGDRLSAQGKWREARAQFALAAKADASDTDAAARVRMCDRRMRTEFAGFEMVAGERDPVTGLPREVRVAGTGMSMVLVAGGEFDMGSDRFPVAKPVHTVSVGPFYLGKYEVTQEEWTALMGSNPSANVGGGRLPVEMVSWEDAQAFVARLNRKVAGGGFRLPREAEWEFAARAAKTVKPVGARTSTRAVGSGAANQLGLHDLLGNVWEWCGDTEGPLRYLRGGGFADSADLQDPAMRHGERPARRMRWNGLRLARSVPE